MNLLGFIITLLALLALSSSYFYQQTISSLEVKQAYRGYVSAARDAQNDLAKKMYRKVRKKETPPQKNSFAPPTTKVEEEKQQKLEEFPECVVLNIAPLIHDGKEAHKEIYEYLCSLVRVLYRDNLLSNTKDKNPERHFVDLLLASIEEEKPSTIAKITLKDPSFQILYYKMLKGQQKGYPSLLDYIRYSPGGKQKKICLSCSNRQILTALFNKKVADALWREKEEEMDFLEVNEDMLQSLFSQNQFIMNHLEIQDLISLRHKKTKPAKTVTIKGSDSQSQIEIKRKAYF